MPEEKTYHVKYNIWSREGKEVDASVEYGFTPNEARARANEIYTKYKHLYYAIYIVLDGYTFMQHEKVLAVSKKLT